MESTLPFGVPGRMPQMKSKMGGKKRIRFSSGHKPRVEEATHCLATFKVKADLKHGETLFVIGDSPSLGSWNFKMSLPLDTSPNFYPIWKVTAPIKKGKPIQYSYGVMSGGTFSRMENLAAKRCLEIPKASTSFSVFDILDSPEKPDEDMKIDPQESENIRKIPTSTKGQGESSGELSITDGFTIVRHFLPVIVDQNLIKKEWVVDWNYESMFSRKEATTADRVRLKFIGCPRFKNPSKVKFDDSHFSKEKLTEKLRKFRCIPVYIPDALHKKHYTLFGRRLLKKVMYNILDIYNDNMQHFWMDNWLAYMKVNKLFSDKIVETFSERDIVWIHLYEAYELMMLPSLLMRKILGRVHLGVMVHGVWASSEIFKTLPQREDLLRGILSADQVGFHAYEDARKFMICCSRILGLEFHYQDGKAYVEFQGKKVTVSICYGGISEGYIRSKVFKAKEQKAIELYKKKAKELFPKDGKIILGIDQVDGFSGVYLKLLAFDKFLQTWPSKEINKSSGLICFANDSQPPSLVQILLPSLSTSAPMRTTIIKSLAKKLNEAYETPPILIIEDELSVTERLAIFCCTDILMLTPTRACFNRFPLEFVAVHAASRLRVNDVNDDTCPVIILSEFSASARPLPGALKVNPWDIHSMLRILGQALKLPPSEKRYRFDADTRFVKAHTFGIWVNIMLEDLKQARDLDQVMSYGFGFGNSYKSIAFRTDFRPLDSEKLATSYKNSSRRLILLDFTGTLVSSVEIDESFNGAFGQDGTDSGSNGFYLHDQLETINQNSPMPSKVVLSSLKSLCADKRNLVFVISERQITDLEEAFGEIKDLGLIAEHGFYFSWPANKRAFKEPNDESTLHRQWEVLVDAIDTSWMSWALNVMEGFTQRTTGSLIKRKGSTILWDYSRTEGDFGQWQARELTQNLSHMLKDFRVGVFHGKGYVDVHPLGCGKDKACEQIVNKFCTGDKFPDFIFCIGDDTSDEMMFEYFRKLCDLSNQDQTQVAASLIGRKSKIRTVVVGQKPSSAQFYVEDEKSVESLIGVLAKISVRQKHSVSTNDVNRFFRQGSKESVGDNTVFDFPRQLSNLPRNRSMSFDVEEDDNDDGIFF